MTVIVVGKGSNGNLLISDALVTMKDNLTSYKDCRLKDKIAKLYGSKCYCSIIGDENVLYGIMELDHWYLENSVQIDFENEKYMDEALIASERFIELHKNEGHIQPLTDGATVYFMNRKDIIQYRIQRKNNKYSIKSSRSLNDNEVLINYGGHIERIELFDFPIEQYFEKACRIIEDYHKKRKRLSKQKGKKLHLHYDFDDRFCGVVFPASVEFNEKIYIPFRKLSEVIASRALDSELTWTLIENESYSWTPDFK